MQMMRMHDYDSGSTAIVADCDGEDEQDLEDDHA